MNRRKIYTLLFVLLMTVNLSSCGGSETLELEAESGEIQEQEMEPAQTEAVKPEPEQTELSVLFVHICGAVNTPGVYELPAGSRVFEAVQAAGGFTEEADVNYVNQAMILADASRLVIPTTKETENAKMQELPLQEEAEAIPSGSFGESLVNINTADGEELCTLPGIGKTRADAIIAYREKNGGFSTIEDIMEVEGIKDGTFQKLKEKITVR